MVQPLVTEVETVVAAIVMAVKATEHHGKQNTKPTFFQSYLRSDPHLPQKKTTTTIVKSASIGITTTNLSVSRSLSDFEKR